MRFQVLTSRHRLGARARLILLIGALLALGLIPRSAHAVCAFPPVGDGDCDALPDGTDPCPLDPLNRCAGAVALCASSGGNCASSGTALRWDAVSGGGQTDCNGDVWGAETGSPLGSSFDGGSTSIDPNSVTAAFGCSSAATQTMVKD